VRLDYNLASNVDQASVAITHPHRHPTLIVIPAKAGNQRAVTKGAGFRPSPE
jgi:hypothetical protein